MTSVRSTAPQPGSGVRGTGAGPDRTRARAWRRDLHYRFPSRYRVVWFALAALLVLCALTARPLFSHGSLVLVTGLAGVLAVASAGQLLVIMSGGFDLSVPAMITLAGAVVVKQTQGADDRLVLAIGEALVAAAAVGLVNGLLVAFARVNAFIVTLAMNSVVTGATVLWATTTYSASGKPPKSLIDFAGHTVGPISALGIVGLVVLATLAVMLRSTTLGRGFIAAGANPVAARIIGVRVRAYEVSSYVLAAMLFVIAGILLAGLLQAPNGTIGDPYQLSTIVAAALGGATLTGGPASMLCTGAGCLFVTVLSQFLALEDFGAGVQYLANGVVLVAAVAMVTAGGGGRILRLVRLARS